MYEPDIKCYISLLNRNINTYNQKKIKKNICIIINYSKKKSVIL